MRTLPSRDIDSLNPIATRAGAIYAGSAIPHRADRRPQDPVQGPGEQGEADRRPDLLLGPASSLRDGLGDRATELPGQTGQGGFAQGSDDRAILGFVRPRWHTSAIP